MRLGLTVSSLGHAALLAWGMVALPGVDPFEAMSQEPLPVELVSVEEFTEIRAGTRNGDAEVETAAPEVAVDARPSENPDADPDPDSRERTAPEPAREPESPEAAEPEPELEETAALPQPAAEPEPAPEPEPEPQAEAPEPPPQPTDVPVPRAKPQVAERPQTVEPRRDRPSPESDFDADRIAALLNKVPEAGGTVRAETQSDTPSLGSPTGDRSRMSVSEIDALRQQIARCWNPPVGVVDAGEMRVRLGLELNPDGSLSGAPRVLNTSSDPIFRIAAEAAMRAVNRCEPYSLPAEKYDSWRQIHVNFDPRELLGG